MIQVKTVKQIISIFIINISINISFANTNEASPCKDKLEWKKDICELSKKKMQHSAWGTSHGERDYLLAKEIAKNDDITFDDDVLFASSILHDLGAFKEFQDPNDRSIDHAIRTNQVIDKIILKTNFPNSKIKQLKEAMISHMHDTSIQPLSNEAILLHNADTLNFLGTLGITRIISRVGNEFPNIESAIAFIKSININLNQKLIGSKHSFLKKVGRKRSIETTKFIQSLYDESFEILGD